MELHKIQIRNKEDHKEKLSTRNNIEILVDGKPFKGITELNLNIQPGCLALVQIAMIAEIDIELDKARLITEAENVPPQFDLVNGAGEVVGKIVIEGKNGQTKKN